MTLILTVANATAAHQSSDYQLTDGVTGAPVSDRAGSKQLQATFEALEVRLAFTGIAQVGLGSSGRRTVDWLAAEINALPHEAKLEEICDALKERSSRIASPFGSRGVLELVLTTAAIGNHCESWSSQT